MALHQLSQRRGLAQESYHGPGSGQKWDNREWWGRSLGLRTGQWAPQEDILAEILSNLSLLMARLRKKKLMAPWHVWEETTCHQRWEFRTRKEKEHGDVVIQDKARPAWFSDLSKAKVKEGHATRQIKVSKSEDAQRENYLILTSYEVRPKKGASQGSFSWHGSFWKEMGKVSMTQDIFKGDWKWCKGSTS